MHAEIGDKCAQRLANQTLLPRNTLASHLYAPGFGTRAPENSMIGPDRVGEKILSRFSKHLTAWVAVRLYSYVIDPGHRAEP
jgi:hypothetical protein